MINLDAETAMNLIGLILIAALSGGIVGVSLRLRTSLSSDSLWLDGERLPEDDWQTRGHGGGSLRDPFGSRLNRRSFGR